MAGTPVLAAKSRLFNLTMQRNGSMKHNMQKQHGFTLIEAMITVAILGILAAIGVSTYDAQKRKGYRSDAIRALTEAAQLEERWYSNNGIYGTLANIQASATSPNGHYGITAVNASHTYAITATAVAGQLNDEKCRTFTIDQAGRKTSTDSSAAASTGCWPK